MEATFRPAGVSDIDALLPMIRELCEFDRTPFDEGAAQGALAQLVADESLGGIWLIESGGRMAGYLVITYGFSLEFGGRDAFIDELFLREEFRGRGLGRRALEFAEAVCRGRGVRALLLEVEHHNAAARKVYRRSGFANRDFYLMVKRL
ncbi:MAG TPA: GNAT family N-acetyltransferase [Pyrinomonadaceae bacterium]|nr:GNAT family N-acetyltransferase [Pyrinomonadaceae bacterium]